ncbi:MAG: nicotinate (nicotinamide) nucleotide adenylyltransferase [Acidobacteriaceae bacterium]|nr:nicotinate (nicotinamide) nucleotide adenylyltransferase [Acidobacteriaceae bacterium]
MSQRVCLFGGTFDPIHSAHLRIAQEALHRCHLDRVLFIPAGNPPHKDASGLTPYEDRFRMVEIACAPYPQFAASRLEEGQARSYTIDTVKRFRKELAPDDHLFFLIGGDAFDEIKTWKNWPELIQLTEFVVVARPGRKYRIPEGAVVHRLDKLALPVSSSGIRARLAEGGPTPELPKKVRALIEERGLYSFGKTKATVSP